MQQHDVMLEDGGEYTEEQVVGKLARSGHLRQVLPRCHVRNEVLQFILPKKVPHLLQYHLPETLKLKS